MEVLDVSNRTHEQDRVKDFIRANRMCVANKQTSSKEVGGSFGCSGKGRENSKGRNPTLKPTTTVPPCFAAGQSVDSHQ